MASLAAGHGRSSLTIPRHFLLTSRLSLWRLLRALELLSSPQTLKRENRYSISVAEPAWILYLLLGSWAMQVISMP
jgi:hypothetical protein